MLIICDLRQKKMIFVSQLYIYAWVERSKCWRSKCCQGSMPLIAKSFHARPSTSTHSKQKELEYHLDFWSKEIYHPGLPEALCQLRFFKHSNRKAWSKLSGIHYQVLSRAFRAEPRKQINRADIVHIVSYNLFAEIKEAK